LTLREIGRRVGVSYTSAANALRRQGRTDLVGRRGFAALSPERRRELAGRGSKAAQAKGTAHRYTSEEAAAAGRKGGRAAQEQGTAYRFAGAKARGAGRKGERAGAGDRPQRVAEAARRQAEAIGTRLVEMAEMWAAGLTLAEIGERFGVTRQAVGAALRAVEAATEGER
jgi:hypothetical protein